MSHYRTVYRCEVCGKIYRSRYLPSVYVDRGYDLLCGRCGSYRVRRAIAKPKMFGLKGWKVHNGGGDETTK